MNEDMNKGRTFSGGGLLALGALVFVGGAVLLARADRRGTSEGVQPTPRQAAVERQLTAEPAMPDTAPSLGVELLDSRATFEAFWGARADEVAEALFPGQPEAIDGQYMAEWEDASDVLVTTMSPSAATRVDLLYRRYVSWPGWTYSADPLYPIPAQVRELTPDSLAAALGEPRIKLFDQQTVEGWAVELLDLNTRLDGVTRRYLETAGERVEQRFANNTIERAPLGFPDERAFGDTHHDALMVMSFGSWGWNARYALDRSDNPDLAAMYDEIQELRDERSQFVRAKFGF